MRVVKNTWRLKGRHGKQELECGKMPASDLKSNELADDSLDKLPSTALPSTSLPSTSLGINGINGMNGIHNRVSRQARKLGDATLFRQK